MTINDIYSENEEFWHLAVDAVSLGIWEWDIRSDVLKWSKDVEPMFGLESNTFDNNYHSFLDLVYPDDVETIKKATTRSLEEDVPYSVVYRVQWSDRIIRWHEAKGKVYRNSDGEPYRMIGTVLDITQQKKNEEQIHKLLVAVEHSPAPVMITDANGVIEYVNRQFTQHYGYTSQEVYGKTPNVVSSGEHSQDYYKELLKTLNAGEKWQKEICNRKKNGEQVWEMQSIAPLKDKSGNVTHFVSVKLDDTERKLAADKLKISQQRLQTILDHSSTVIYMKDLDGRYILANKQFQTLFNIDEPNIIGNSDYDLFSKDIADNFHAHDLKTFEANAPIEVEETIIQNDSILTYLSVKFPILNESGTPTAVCGISTDITLRKKMEEELATIEKLKSVGVLAGGIAHDFNNLLTIILSGVELAKMNLQPTTKGYTQLKRAENACQRAKSLTHQLLTFAKGGTPIKETTEIALLIPECVKFSLSGSSIRCEFKIAKDLWLIDADKGQISQVIQNIVINADQAMYHEGTIDLVAENIDISDVNNHSLPAGKYVKVSITDNGIGISEKHIKKIFDPYFTTKNEGCGLGLAICYSIITKHGGCLNVDSTIGKGTTFSIYLPARFDEKISISKAEKLISSGEHGKILIVDDEELIRDPACEYLGLVGYTVEEASDGQEAIDLYKRSLEIGDPFDLVIMDLTIPGGMGGVLAISKLLEIDPQVKALVSSGYANDDIMSNFKEYGFQGAIPKPYKLTEMSDAIKQVI